MEGYKLRKAVFNRFSEIEPQGRYNLYAEVVQVVSNLTIKRVDADPIKMAICVVGDDTGCARLLLKDAHTAFAKEGERLILRNAHAKIIKDHIRLEVDIWGKVEKCAEVRWRDELRRRSSAR